MKWPVGLSRLFSSVMMTQECACYCKLYLVFSSFYFPTVQCMWSASEWW